MPKIELSWAALARELTGWEKKLAAGTEPLRRAGNPSPGGTTRELVMRHGKAALYRYAPRSATPQTVPTLIVYALVNRPSMADLEPERSLIRGLLERGVAVHLIEWEDPGVLDAGLGLADYLNADLDACVKALDADARPINLMGICQGGTFALCYAAMNPQRIRNLVLTVTPVDFHTADDQLSRLLRHVELDRLGAANLSGDALNGLFLSLKPYRLLVQKYVGLLEQLGDPAQLATFLRMERWIFDSPDLAGQALMEFARDFYRDNLLCRGGLRIGGRPVDPARLTMPVLNLYARDDHLVPPAASVALKALVGTGDYTEVELPGGHIGVYVGSSCRTLAADTIGGWLKSR